MAYKKIELFYINIYDKLVMNIEARTKILFFYTDCTELPSPEEEKLWNNFMMWSSE